MRTRFGFAERLDPPVSVGGRAYSLLLKFRSSAESDEFPGQLVRTVKVARAVSRPDGGIDVWLAREGVTFSRTRTIELGNSSEETWVAACGGTHVSPPEPLRLYGWQSSMNYRGDKREDTIERGDIARFGPPGAEQWLYINAALPMAGRPVGGVVDWRPADGLPLQTWIGADIQGDLVLTVDPADDVNGPFAVDLVRTVDGAGMWRGSGVFLEVAATPGTFTRLTRRVYTRPGDGLPDQEFFPVGGTLAAGEYWLDGVELRLVVGSANAAVGNRVVVLLWETGWRQWDNVVGRAVVLEGAGTGEPAGLGGVVANTGGDGIGGVFVYTDTGGSFGRGWLVHELSVRTGGSVGVAVGWSGDAIVAIRARTSPPGAWAPLTFEPRAIVAETTGFAFLSIQLDAGVLTVRLSDEDEVDAVLAVVDVSAWVQAGGHNGYFGVRAAAGDVVRWQGMDGVRVTVVGGARVWRGRLVDFGAVAYSQDYTMPSAADPTAVLGLGGVVYTAASGDGAKARGRYEWDALEQKLTLWAENAGDVVRVTQPPPPVPGSPPGRAPRLATDVTNLVTLADEETGIGTTVPEENRANWHDVLVVYPPGDAVVALSPGDELVVHRGAVATDRVALPGDEEGRAWRLEWARKNGVEPAWQAVPDDAVVARPPEGVWLVAAEWLATVGGAVCFRLVYTSIRHEANLDARTINELGGAVDRLDELSFRVGQEAAPDLGLGGTIRFGGFRLVATGFTVIEVGGEPVVLSTGLAWGGAKGDWTGAPEFVGNVLEYGSLGVPIWGSNSFLGSTGGGYHGPTENALPAAVWEGETLRVVGETATTNIPAEYWPAMVIPGDPGLPGVFGFGTEYPVPPIGVGDPQLLAHFKVSALSFTLPPQLRRALAGTIIRSARMEVRMGGVASWDWQMTRQRRESQIGGAVTGGFDRFVYTLNGVIYREYEQVGGVVLTDYTAPEFPAARTGARLSFDLVGRARRSRRIPVDYLNAAYLWSGGDPEDEGARLSYIGGSDWRNLPGDEWGTFGAGGVVTSELEEGKWGIVDVSAALQAMLSARGSLYGDFYLVPRGTGPGVEAGLDDLAGYLRSCLPVSSVTTEADEVDPTVWTVEWALDAQYTRFTSLEWRNLIVSIQVADGVLAEYEVPVRRVGLARE